jgi:hypothetical protein
MPEYNITESTNTEPLLVQKVGTNYALEVAKGFRGLGERKYNDISLAFRVGDDESFYRVYGNSIDDHQGWRKILNDEGLIVMARDTLCELTERRLEERADNTVMAQHPDYCTIAQLATYGIEHAGDLGLTETEVKRLAVLQKRANKIAELIQHSYPDLSSVLENFGTVEQVIVYGRKVHGKRVTDEKNMRSLANIIGNQRIIFFASSF